MLGSRDDTWVITKTIGGCAYWLTAYLGKFTFSADENDALHLARERDAYLVKNEILDDDELDCQPIKVIRYQWDN